MDSRELRKLKGWWQGDGKKFSTIQARIRYLKRVNIDLDEIINSGDFYMIAEWLFCQEITDGARDNFVKAINVYLKFRDVNYRLKKTPCRGEPDIWIPDEKEVEKIMNVKWTTPHTTRRNHLLLKILFIGALRRGEVRKLKFSDFRTTSDKKIQHITYHYIHVFGKGNKERFVDIPEDLHRLLILYKERDGTKSGFVFDNSHGIPISGSQVGKICRQAGRRAGVSLFHTHTARHYRTIELDAQGVSIDAIRRFLGHSSISTTQTYLRGRRNKTRDELVSKDAKFRGLREKIKKSKRTSGEDTNEG